ncbi:MBL fold metallo-hydrolase [Oceanobacillus sp. Castelsardo]|uniref:MBL fold metallo-hydrolase n=1 Tax=Oceanobacillus sp. Castelsardo TaxID=1851204 RepID=UPI000838455F|nr:MBL fold metallo-hydrolase [Oceanobacillus sp. Castelsardo]
MNRKSTIQVIRVPIPTPTLLPHTTTNSYLIGNEKESILVDAGYDTEVTRKLLEWEIKKHRLATPKRIVLTHAHPDHAAGVRMLIHWIPTIICHEKEKEEVLSAISPWEEITLIEDGDSINVDGEEIVAMHAPGHTLGHLSLYIPSQQILIAGDNIVAEGTTWIGAPGGDMKDYFQTLRRLRNLKIKKIGPGHGNWVHQPYEHIDFVIQRRLQREQQILTLLEKHQQVTSKELTEMIYQDRIHPSIFPVAQKTIEAHLDKLLKEDLIQYNESKSSYVSPDFQ